MASGDNRMYTINVRYESQRPIAVRVDTNWTFGRLRQEIAGKVNKPVEEIKLIFQGRQMSDELVIRECDLGNNSVLNAVKGQGIPLLTLDLQTMSLTDPSLTVTSETPEEYRNQFYVFCKNPCGKVQPGKIRVRCRKCLESAFTVDRDPCNWDDILTPCAINGHCHLEHCDGTIAEFFFKCKAHDSQQFETSTPLSMIKPNRNHVDCIVCLEDQNPMVVFPCEDGHCICLECFQQHCEFLIQDRGFKEIQGVGYTISCPAGCEEKYVTDGHHFRIMGDDLYQRYQRFATEEIVLQMGGVLCPKQGCGEGILPEDTNRRITCPTCQHTFCKNCKEAFHTGDCDATAPAPSQDSVRFYPQNAQRARFELEARRVIKETTKKCPQCKVPTEKNGGCMHMTCPRCGFNWCWLCKIEWGRGCQDDHWFGE